MTWIIDNSQRSIVFSKMFKKNENKWVIIYNWCNEEFDSNNWHFWYDSTQADADAIIANIEFLQEQDAIQFQLQWG